MSQLEFSIDNTPLPSVLVVTLRMGRMSQLEFGMDNVTTYLTLCVGIWLFKPRRNPQNSTRRSQSNNGARRFLINKNWRWTQLWPA